MPNNNYSSSQNTPADIGAGTVALSNLHGGNGSVPFCRCRVLYIGSAVPTVTKDGLQCIQQPLKERYPANENTETKGIDSWLSVWSNGLLLEYVDGTKRTESAFFPIVTLHYCAAVRYVNVNGFAIEGGGERFIPLDTPFAHIPESPHPPIFAAIFRRTSGIKVLECHAFICTNERAANALVRCCFHSYADTIYLKMDEKMGGLNTNLKAIKESLSRSVSPTSELNLSENENNTTMAIDEMREESNWNERAIGQKAWQRRQQNGEYDSSSISSSLYKHHGMSNKKNSKRESIFENDGIILPYVENRHHNVRRSGSHSDIRDYYDPEFSHYERGTPVGFRTGPPPLPPGAMRTPPPMPPGFMPPYPIFYPAPQPMMMMNGSGSKTKSGKCLKNSKSNKHAASLPTPPPFFAGRIPPQPPHPFLHAMPPPHFLPPHLRQRFATAPFGRPGMPMMPILNPRMFFMPPAPMPPFGSPMHFAMMERARQAASATENAPAGSGPIITESIYDTFPRNRITHEEPIYMPSNYGHYQDTMMNSSYNPSSISPENYETFYETHRKRKSTMYKKNASGSDSDASGEASQADNGQPKSGPHSSNRFWEAYEANIYRKSHINEKAFANTIARTTSDNNNNDEKVNNNKINGNYSAGKITGSRPNTPPADYDYDARATTPTAAKQHNHLHHHHHEHKTKNVGGVSAY